MLVQLATAALGIVNFWLFFLFLIIAFTFFLPFALVKLLIPVPPVRRFMTRMMDRCGRWPWRLGNKLPFQLAVGRRDIEIEGLPLSPEKSWLLVSNHRSWVDIPLLVDVLGRQAPFPRFFLKRQLIWVPVIGFAGWAFDMPFMKRHTKAQIAANPSLARDDIDATRRSCEKFQSQPVTVVNFIEGTRFTQAKRDRRGSPYQNLLRPKAGGLAFAVGAMGEQFAGVIDVTVAYRDTRRGPLWGFLCGEQRGMQVHVAVRPLPPELLHREYQADAEFRVRFQKWINGLWREKDARISRFLARQALGNTGINGGNGGCR